MTTADPYTWPTWPEPAHIQILRLKVAAVEALIVKHRTPPHDGRVPAVQILSAWLDIEENRP